jgi:hypothetical protein
LEELAMPDLDLIKQGEQGVRDRRGRFARGTMKKIPRMVPMAEIMKKLANMKKLMIAIRSRDLGPVPRCLATDHLAPLAGRGSG